MMSAGLPAPKESALRSDYRGMGIASRRWRLTAMGVAGSVLLCTLVVAPRVAHAAGVGGSEDTYTTTTTTTHRAASAVTGQPRLFDFGPVKDPNPPNGCQVTIAWGDGTTSLADLGSPDSSGEEEVTATHTFTLAGSYQATQSATPGCVLGAPTVTTTPITVGDFVLGTNTNTNYDQTIFDVTVADAASSTEPPSLGTGQGGNSGQAPQPPASLCGSRTRLFDLLDVYPARGRVQLVGYGDPLLAGQSVRILSGWNGQLAARTTVGRDGYFRASAPLPPRRVRDTNLARYEAQDGSLRSARLKLSRRMYVFRVTQAGTGQVEISGQALLPLTQPSTAITVFRRDNCQQPGYTRVPAQVTLNKRTGKFTVLAPAPPSGATGAVYRLTTRLRRSTTNLKAFPTFTLPRTIASQ
jgi:hypothetical protein